MREIFLAWSESLEQFVLEVIYGQRKGKRAALLRAALYSLSKVFTVAVKARLDGHGENLGEGVKRSTKQGSTLTLALPVDYFQDELLKRFRPSQEDFPHQQRSVPSAWPSRNVFNGRD